MRSLFSCLITLWILFLVFLIIILLHFFLFFQHLYLFAGFPVWRFFSIIVLHRVALFDGYSRSVLGCYCLLFYFIIVIFLQRFKIVKEIKKKYLFNHQPQLINKLTHFLHQKAHNRQFPEKKFTGGLKS